MTKDIGNDPSEENSLPGIRICAFSTTPAAVCPAPEPAPAPAPAAEFESARPPAGEAQENRLAYIYTLGICWRRGNARRMIRNTRSTWMSVDSACLPSNSTESAERDGISCRNASIFHVDCRLSPD